VTPQQRESFRFVPVAFAGSAPPANVSVVASTTTAFAACGNAPCPLATDHFYGSGIISTILIPWFEGGDRELSRLAETLLERAFDQVAPLQITWEDDEGFPVDFIATSSRAAGTFTAIVSNNDEAVWRGNATVAGPDAPVGISNCQDLLSGQRVQVVGATMVGVSADGFDVSIVRCDAEWSL
jgi:hypothetical protein